MNKKEKEFNNIKKGLEIAMQEIGSYEQEKIYNAISFLNKHKYNLI